jgi:hypothetical protein
MSGAATKSPFERKTELSQIDHRQLAVEFLDAAKKEYSDPSCASSLALIGIGNALLHIAEQLKSLGDLDWLKTMVGPLDENARRPAGSRRPDKSQGAT